jgi:hypothetical protein
MNRIDCFKKKSFQKSPEKIHKETSLYSKWYLIFLGFRLRKVHESAKSCSKQDSTAITKKTGVCLQFDWLSERGESQKYPLVR